MLAHDANDALCVSGAVQQSTLASARVARTGAWFGWVELAIPFTWQLVEQSRRLVPDDRVDRLITKRAGAAVRCTRRVPVEQLRVQSRLAHAAEVKQLHAAVLALHGGV